MPVALGGIRATLIERLYVTTLRMLPSIALIVGYVVLTEAVGLGIPISLELTGILFCLFMPAALALGSIVRVSWALTHRARGRSRRRVAWLACRPLFTIEAFTYSAILSLGMIYFFFAFAAWKQHIPDMVGYWADPVLMRMDRLVHGGIDPWRLLEPLLRSPLALRALDIIYLLWHPIMIGAFLANTVDDPGPRRQQFLLAYFSAWVVLGTGVSTVVASAGPVYFQHIVGAAGPYQPLLGRLAQAGISNTELQDALWRAYTHRGTTPFAGISAMPSMHVAMAFLIACASWRFGWAVRLATALYALGILIGSVVLGWHYAIDGYVAAVGAVGIWLVAGPVARSYWRALECLPRTRLRSRVALVRSPALARAPARHMI